MRIAGAEDERYVRTREGLGQARITLAQQTGRRRPRKEKKGGGVVGLLAYSRIHVHTTTHDAGLY